MHVCHLLLNSLGMAGTWLSRISWLRMSENTLPDKLSLLRNLVCGVLLMTESMTALSKLGLGWKISTLMELMPFLPGSAGEQRPGGKMR